MNRNTMSSIRFNTTDRDAMLRLMDEHREISRRYIVENGDCNSQRVHISCDSIIHETELPRGRIKVVTYWRDGTVSGFIHR